jgi:hypothetical protein
VGLQETRSKASVKAREETLTYGVD